MTTKTTAQRLADAREIMQHLIETNSPLREKHERLINNLKAELDGVLVCPHCGAEDGSPRKCENCGHIFSADPMTKI